MAQITEQSIKASKDACNEILGRLKLIEDAIMLFHFLGHELDRKIREAHKHDLPLQEERLRYIVTSYAFIQTAAILDCNGMFSLHVRKDKGEYCLSKSNFSKLFPVLDEETKNEVLEKTNLVLQKHKRTIETVFKTRHEKIAHIGRITYKLGKTEDYSWYIPSSLIPTSFRYKRLLELSRDLDDALCWPIGSYLDRFFGNIV